VPHAAAGFVIFMACLGSLVLARLLFDRMLMGKHA
jgi:hypothetical protein